jgi:hypothetical protein
VMLLQHLGYIVEVGRVGRNLLNAHPGHLARALAIALRRGSSGPISATDMTPTP